MDIFNNIMKFRKDWAIMPTKKMIRRFLKTLDDNNSKSFEFRSNGKTTKLVIERFDTPNKPNN